MTFFKIFVVLTLLTTISGCRALSDALAPDKTASSRDLPAVKRENPNLSSEPKRIDVDPDSDNLLEETKSEANTKQQNVEANTKPKNVEPSGNYLVTFNSFGGVKVGMTMAQASQALGIELVRGEGYEDACYYVESPGLQGVRFMVTNEKIARIDISSSKYATDKGAKVGDTQDKIKSLYPRANVQPQRYDEKKKDMAIYSEDEQYMIVFETDGKQVTGFRIGNMEEVGYADGCS